MLQSVWASKLVEVKVLDKDYIQLYFKDGEVSFLDDGLGACAHNHCNDGNDSELMLFGTALNTANATTNGNWTLKSSDDLGYGTTGKNPTSIYRKSKLTAMSQEAWSTADNDYRYDWAYEHNIYLKLPTSLVQGKSYTLTINGNTNTDQTTYTFTYDIYTNKSEAIKVNLVGYKAVDAVKSADLYMWLGSNSGATASATRDYTSFIGNKVYVYNIATKQAQEVSTVKFWKAKGTESRHGHKMLQSDVWNADFTGFNTPGTYRLVIEGVGCSQDFVIDNEAYRDPFAVSVLGFFYMRIGQDNLNMTPIPRRPLWIPNTSPSNCKVYLTTMQPYHANWATFTSGDQWDQPADWVSYVESGNPTNPNATGGHSDALDWDRHLGHVSIIYDMLLPYFLQDGAQSDDDVGIAESGNGIPDLLDEAKNEVDFWLRLRSKNGGYSHGLTNPIKSTNALYQAGETGVAAWANAANAAMLANAFLIAGKTSLMNEYRDSAIAAYNYAGKLGDQQLTKEQGVGYHNMSGLDFKLTAAAFLYNVTGDIKFEDDYKNGSKITSSNSVVNLADVYGIAAYLKTPQTVHYTTLQNNIKASLIARAKDKEANYSVTRPSRRANDNDIGWMQTEIGVQRTMVAHAVSDDGADKQLFANALMLEADYSLGRNPMNRILMTTATTNLSNKRSIENAYTSGWDDGTPGVHPGHTPYMNPFDWGGLIMGRPEWMTSKCYPNAFTGGQNSAGMQWPMAELYFNTRYVYAHCEFTPQQTMKGKTALYAYLHGMGPSCDRPNLGSDKSICGTASMTLNSGLASTGRTFVWKKNDVLLQGETKNTLAVTSAGAYEVTSNEGGCVKKSTVNVLDILPEVLLGNDITLCNPAKATLDAGVSGNGITYTWELNGNEIPDAKKQTYEVIAGGTYKVTISATGCTNKSDEIIVSSLLVNVINDTICGSGVAKLSVQDAGSYTWHSGSTTEDLLSSTNAYSPSVSATSTYYVEDANGISTAVGPTAPGNSTWASFPDSYTQSFKFTTSIPITLESVKVVAYSAGKVVVNLYTTPGGTPLQTISTNVSSGEVIVNVGFQIAPGTYYLNAAGSTASMAMDNENGTYVKYPYTVDGVISITGIEPAWASKRYLHFYNWQVSTGNTCERTPVKAVVLNVNDPKCNINNIDDRKIESKLYPNPTNDAVMLPSKEQYQVFNIVGEIVLDGFGDRLTLIDVPNGIYFIKTSLGIEKIIKQ